MSVVAWDGKFLAADRQGDANGLKLLVSKSKRLPEYGVVVAWTGGIGEGMVLADWYASNARPETYPAFQSDQQRWSRLIVATKSGVVYYEQAPVAIPVLEKFAAFGSGRDYALGALAMGADAKTAVEIACRFDSNCGLGVDVYDLTAED